MYSQEWPTLKIRTRTLEQMWESVLHPAVVEQSLRSPQGKVTFVPLPWCCIAVASALESWIGMGPKLIFPWREQEPGRCFCFLKKYYFQQHYNKPEHHGAISNHINHACPRKNPAGSCPTLMYAVGLVLCYVHCPSWAPHMFCCLGQRLMTGFRLLRFLPTATLWSSVQREGRTRP